MLFLYILLQWQEQEPCFWREEKEVDDSIFFKLPPFDFYTYFAKRTCSNFQLITEEKDNNVNAIRYLKLI